MPAGKDLDTTSGARGYSWAPFEDGNTAAVSHGTRSERLVSSRAQQVREMLLEKYEYLADDAFAEALARYVRIEARALMLSDYIAAKVGAAGDDLIAGVEAVPRTLWTEATRADMAAQKAAQDCGLDPTGHARIARDLGFAKSLGQQHNAKRLTALSETGRALREGNPS